MGQAERRYAAYYTIAEWERWQDQWELIDGVPYCMSPAPSTWHQRINFQIARHLENNIEAGNCRKCKVYIPIDWQISDDTVVQPDILIVCKPVKGIRLTEAPEAIFEILSPSTEKKDRTEKYDLYQAQKVKYYTLVNPATEEIEIFILGEDGLYKKMELTNPFTYRFEECEVEIDFNNIWE